MRHIKIVTGKYDPVVAPSLSRSVDNLWKSLHNRVVMSDSTNIFKNKLDSFWEGQDIIYDFRARLYGTGSRSEIRIE